LALHFIDERFRFCGKLELSRVVRLLHGSVLTRHITKHEYNAIRNAAALIDISPLFKYRVSERDATRLVDRIITRDVSKVAWAR